MRVKREPNAEDADELMRVQAAVEASGDVAYDWDLASDTVTWSRAPGALRPVIGENKLTTGAEFLRLIYPDELLARRRALARHVQAGEAFDCEYRIGDGNGSCIWVHERGSARLSDDGRPLRLVGTLRVIDKRKRREAKLRYQVNHDLLTGFFNRARLCEELDSILRFNRKFGQNGAYLVAGIDRLNIINDAFGPATGDAILQELAGRLDTRPAVGDVLGRVGGDCFGVVVARCTEPEIEIVAERILEGIRAEPVDTPSGPIHVTASIGAVVLAGGPASAYHLLAKAEFALREAKRAGRNCYVLYDRSESPRHGAEQSVAIAEQVQQALRQERLCLEYQPIIDSASGGVCLYEALLRMVDDGGRLVTAGSFMPVIEEMGLVRQVDRRVLELVAAELRHDPDVMLAVNVSGLTACDKSWLARLVELADADPLLPRRLMIELTETVALREVDRTAYFVNAVRDLGCRVALDDFGAGYSSFKNLRAFAVDVVKIDGSFVKNVAGNRDNRLFVKSLVGLAQGFSLNTVAECVECEADAAILRAHGVDFMQGFYFGRPAAERPWLRPGSTSAQAVQPST